MTEEVAEAVSSRKRECDVAGFLIKRNSGEYLMRNLTLLIVGEGHTCNEGSGGDEPDAGEEDENAGSAGHLSVEVPSSRSLRVDGNCAAGIGNCLEAARCAS